MQWLAVLGSVEDKIVECFHNGGGVHYEEFHRFHEVMAEESAQTVVAALTDHILPLADGLAEQLERGIDVLDIGCGSGRAVCLLAAEFPQQPLRRLRPVRRCRRGRERRSEATGPHERALRSARRVASSATRRSST